MNEVIVNEMVEEAAEKKYKMRDLGAKDIFSISRVISKIGIANFRRCFQGDELTKLVEQSRKEGKSVEQIGADVVFNVLDVLFECLPNCERELFSFIADLLGMKIADVEMIPPADFFDLIVEVVQNPKFADFFTRALRLLK